ncbi:MAG: substrate-binding domain-containing protein [Kiritimatiellia bacterium]|nr:substrate-binding domain-containing protein [Kiritimatiellia bacterium]
MPDGAGAAARGLCLLGRAGTGAARPAGRTSVYFADDNILLGSLLAFARLGIAVPRDVRVATLANRGSGFPYGLSFARIESDPAQFGREVARHALRLLHERTKPAPHVCRLRYIPGDTFPA